MFGLRGLDPQVRQQAEDAFKLARDYDMTPVVTSVRRSWAEQLRLRESWERGESKFPANKPGDSAHQYGLAFDSWVPDYQMACWVQIRQSVGLRVPAGDLIHAERPEWRSTTGLNPYR